MTATADPLSTTLYDAAKFIGSGQQQQGLGPTNLRRAKVLSWDNVTMTGTVSLDGDDTVPVPVKAMNAAAVPVVGAMGWVFQNGTDIILSGTDPTAATTPTSLRHGVVQSRNSGAKTCTVLMDDDSSTATGVGLLNGTVVPIVGQGSWCLQSGSSMVVAGSDAGIPRVRARSTATDPSVTTEHTWVFGAGAVEYDTDFDGTNSMFDVTSGGFIVRWPGLYAYGAHNFAATPSTNCLVVARIKLNSTTFIDAWQQNCTNNAAMHINMANVRTFAVGDFIELRISASTACTFGTNSNEIGAALWMHWVG